MVDDGTERGDRTSPPPQENGANSGRNAQTPDGSGSQSVASSTPRRSATHSPGLGVGGAAGGPHHHHTPTVEATPGRFSVTPGDTDAVDPTPVPITPSRSPRRIGLPTGRVNEVTVSTPGAHHHHVAHGTDTTPSDQFRSPGGSTEPRPRRVIWGTDVNVDDCFERLTNFLKLFAPEDDSEETPYYMRVLEKVHEIEETVVNVDLCHIESYDAALYGMIVNYPTEMIGIFDLALQDVYKELFEEDRRLEIRTFGLKDAQLHSLRKLDPTLINQIVGVRGMIIRCSQIVPDLFRGFYRCTVCAYHESRDVDRGRLAEPTSCPNCHSRGSFEMVHNRGEFNDKQMIRLQEAPESIPQGETPATITVIAYDSLVDNARPGDRVEITGIFRAVPIRVSQRQRSVRSIFRSYVDLIHVRTLGKGRSDRDLLEEDAARDARMREIASSENLYERLAASVAPSIYGMEDVKKAVLLQLFGGSFKDFRDRGWGRLRSEINVLLVGDPGTSKSQILHYVHRLAPRGIFTSGNGSSAVGLTAYVTRDVDSNELVLESGALVLSDQGVCCVDEFDKMSDFTRSILHEAMEQQTISVAKAGIIATLNARTSLLAAANPVNSRYDPKRTVVDNIQLPPTLLSRFDIIFLILDNVNVEEDRRLARHIVSLFYPGGHPHAVESRRLQAVLDAKHLTEYISYARDRVRPKLSEPASDELVRLYVAMRKRGSEGGSGGVRTVSATPRNLESLVRMSEASAKLRLSETVEVSDVEEAHRLMVAAIAQVATDPTTGMLDMDLLNAGQSAAQRNRVKALASTLWNVISSNSASEIRVADLIQRIVDEQPPGIGADEQLPPPPQPREAEVRRALKSLEDDDKVVLTMGGLSVRRVV